MRRYLLAKGELPRQSLVGLCPVNIRDATSGAEGNMVSAMHVALCSDIADPLERLARVHEESESSKAYTRAMGSGLFMELTASIPLAVQTLLVRVGTALGVSERGLRLRIKALGLEL